MVRGGEIRKYDYRDEEENKKHYGMPTPPSYEMRRIPSDLPLLLAYGGADALSVPRDVELLLDVLRGRGGDELVVEYREEYAHADFVWAVNARQVVYDPLIDFFRLH